MNVLITGGLGFIGRALCWKLLEREDTTLVIVDRLSEQVHGPSPDHSDLIGHPAVRFLQADICTPGVLQNALRDIDTVYHLAAETGTGQSMYELQNYYRTNVMGTAVLLEEIVKDPGLRPAHLVLSSSRSVYGEGAYVRASQLDRPDAERHYPAGRTIANMEAGRFDFTADGEPLVSVPTRETDPADPKSIYAASKLAQEQMCQIACASLDVQFTGLRFQNVYGPGQSLRNPYTGILSIFTNILRQGGTIDVFEDGEESRDFVFIDDVVAALAAAPGREPGSPEIINVGHGTRTTVSEVVELLQEKLGTSGKSRVTGRFRAGDIRHCYADISRMKTALGLVPGVELRDGISATVDWALSQPVEADRSEQATRELSSFLGGRK